ncbi:MAG: hypothetical protein ABR549_04900, partial [Mycobacteriales bacterium]
MASVHPRMRKDGTIARQVKFRLGGSRGSSVKSETFDTLRAANRFKAEVDACGQQWPAGWIPGIGRPGADYAPCPPTGGPGRATAASASRTAADDALADTSRHPGPKADDPAFLGWAQQYGRDLTAVGAYGRERYKRQFLRLDSELAQVLGEPV